MFIRTIPENCFAEDVTGRSLLVQYPEYANGIPQGKWIQLQENSYQLVVSVQLNPLKITKAGILSEVIIEAGYYQLWHVIFLPYPDHPEMDKEEILQNWISTALAMLKDQDSDTYTTVLVYTSRYIQYQKSLDSAGESIDKYLRKRRWMNGMTRQTSPNQSQEDLEEEIIYHHHWISWMRKQYQKIFRSYSDGGKKIQPPGIEPAMIPSLFREPLGFHEHALYINS